MTMIPAAGFEPLSDAQMEASILRTAQQALQMNFENGIDIAFPFRSLSAARPMEMKAAPKPEDAKKKTESKPGFFDSLAQLTGGIPPDETIFNHLFPEPETKPDFEQVWDDPSLADEFVRSQAWEKGQKLAKEKQDWVVNEGFQSALGWVFDDPKKAEDPIMTPIPQPSVLARFFTFENIASIGLDEGMKQADKQLLKMLGLDKITDADSFGEQLAAQIAKGAVLPLLKNYLKYKVIELLKEEFPETFAKLKLDDKFLQWKDVAGLGADFVLKYGEQELLKALGLDKVDDKDSVGAHLAAAALKGFLLPELKAYLKDEILGFLKDQFPDALSGLDLSSASFLDRLKKKFGLDDGPACVPIAIRYDPATHKGSITSNCAATVDAGEIPVARAGDGFGCADHIMTVPVTEGWANVLVEGLPIAHHKSETACNARIQASGAHNVFVLDAHPELYLPLNNSMSCTAGGSPAPSAPASAPAPAPASAPAPAPASAPAPAPQISVPDSPAPTEPNPQPQTEKAPEDAAQLQLPDPETLPLWGLLYSGDIHESRNQYNQCPPEKPADGSTSANGATYVADETPFVGGPNSFHGPNSMRGLVDGQSYGFQCNYNADGTLDKTSPEQGSFDRFSFDPRNKYDLPYPIPFPNGVTYIPVDIHVPFTDDTVRLEVPSLTYGHFESVPAMSELPNLIRHGIFDVLPHKIHGGEYGDRTHEIPDERK